VLDDGSSLKPKHAASIQKYRNSIVVDGVYSLSTTHIPIHGNFPVLTPFSVRSSK